MITSISLDHTAILGDTIVKIAAEKCGIIKHGGVTVCYEKNGCTCLFGETAVKIDSVKKEVLLESGKAVSYDKLLVATGSNPFVPPFKGLEKVKDKHSFMSLDDALELEKSLGKDKKVLRKI